ncbi:MAG: DUF2490 domain-containing protein [Sphingobium sp.]|nr:DUF2490 domain-containing protein [Sphingobium sp.]
MTRALLRFAAAALMALPCAAQAAQEDDQLWLQTTVSVKLGGAWQLSNETNYRFSDTRKGLYEIENNLLLNYKVNKTITVAVGYTHDPQYAAGSFAVMERRAREQVTFDNVAKIAGGSIGLRMRAEQRWRNGIAGTGWRFRPYAKYVLPLSKDGKTTVTLGHESFINLNNASFQSQTGWDRMRNNVAVKFPIAKTLNAEIGYLNQYSVVRGGVDRMDHAATASISLSL